jgi:hypothetical protein
MLDDFLKLRDACKTSARYVDNAGVDEEEDEIIEDI